MSRLRKPLSVISSVVGAGVVLVLGVVIALNSAGAHSASAPVEPGAVGSVAPQPSVPPSAIAIASPSAAPASPDACRSIVANVDMAGLTSETKVSNAVLVGTVIDVSAARWATATGAAPDSPARDAGDPFHVYRVVRIQIDQVAKADASVASTASAGSTVAVRVFGGQIGCSEYVVSPQPDMVAGTQLVLYLSRGGQPFLKAAPPADFDAVDAYEVLNGQVVDGSAAPPTVAAYLARVEAVP
jgi:hypothetical protein